MSFWSSKKLYANFIKTLLFILSFWVPIKWILKYMNGSSVSLNFFLHIQFFSFVWHSGTFLCMIFWFINTFSTCGQSAPLSSFWRMGLTFDCHISLLKFPNRSYETTCFHCMEMLDCLPQMVLICTFDGNLLIVKWTVSLGKILCCLPFMGFAFFIYLVILGCHFITKRVMYKLPAEMALGQVTGHAMAMVAFRWQCGAQGGGAKDVVLETDPQSLEETLWIY